MIQTVIIPLVKNRCGDLSDPINYRPVALANVISKVLEVLILSRCEDYLYTTDSQFGFKSQHSTDMCIYLLRELIDFYTRHSTKVFVTFLDATKAFDRINHWKLFHKLLVRNYQNILLDYSLTGIRIRICTLDVEIQLQVDLE